MISAQTRRVCAREKRLRTFPDHALAPCPCTTQFRMDNKAVYAVAGPDRVVAGYHSFTIRFAFSGLLFKSDEPADRSRTPAALGRSVTRHCTAPANDQFSLQTCVFIFQISTVTRIAVNRHWFFAAVLGATRNALLRRRRRRVLSRRLTQPIQIGSGGRDGRHIATAAGQTTSAQRHSGEQKGDVECFHEVNRAIKRIGGSDQSVAQFVF